MKYTRSMAINEDHLKQMILEDSEMTDMEKLHDIFNIDKCNLKGQFPQLYYTILAVLDSQKKPNSDDYFGRGV